MTIRVGFGLALLAASAVAASVVGGRPGVSPPGRGPSIAPAVGTGENPVEPLDRWIQRRMHDHRGFGMSRLVDPFLDLHQFRPESPGEAATLEGLRRSGWSVGIYLGSRDLLAPPKPSEAGRMLATEEEEPGDLSPPISLGDASLPAGLPGADDLRAIGRKALADSGTADSASGTIGRWSVFASLIRADREACLTCHAHPSQAGDPAGPGLPRLGDALGVAIYAYARQDRNPGR